MKIIANSLPKSGTHLLVRLLELLQFHEVHPGLNGALIRPSQRNPINKAKTWFRRCRCGEKNCFKVDLDSNVNGIKERSLNRYLEKIPENGFVAAHIPYSRQLDQKFIDQGLRHIYIIRDPRDVLVSYYDHQVRDQNYPFHQFFTGKTLDEAVPYILNGLRDRHIRLAPLQERIAESRRWVESPNTLALKFEQLIGPSGGGDLAAQKEAIAKVLEFLDFECSDSRVMWIADNLFYRKAETFNKGTIARWKSELGSDSVKLANERLGDLIGALGYAEA